VCASPSAAMHALPARHGQCVRTCSGRGCAPSRQRAPTGFARPPAFIQQRLLAPSGLPAQRTAAGSSERTRRPAAGHGGARRCRRACSAAAERAPGWAAGAPGGTASGARGLLQRLRRLLPSADALALQAGAIRHPKFAPMVLLCAPLGRSTRCPTSGFDNCTDGRTAVQAGGAQLLTPGV